MTTGAGRARFRFALATPDHDAGLRRRMAEDWMDGAIAVSFRREPSYFAGCRVQGERVQVVACIDDATGEIVGLGSRATFTAYVDGTPLRIGYLADLRCAPEHRGGTLLARGYRFLRELQTRDPVPFHTTVIYEGNARARDALTGDRAGLPVYRAAGRLLTPAIHLDWPRPEIAVDGIRIDRATRQAVPEIVRFLDGHARRRQFAAVPREEDFDGGRYAGLRPEDILVARAGGHIVGTIALWDPSAFRQTHVERYSRGLAWLRPFYNAAAAVSPLRPLPAPGTRIPFLYLACFAAADDDLRLGRALLRAAYRAARPGPWHYAIAGLHERDPLAPLLAEYRRIDAAGSVYLVHFPDDAASVPAPDRGVPWLEAGCL